MMRLPIWALIGPALLGILYGLLIYLAVTDRSGFYGAMEMPMPNHGFMHISWTGKTVAIWAMLVVAIGLRSRSLVLLALFGVMLQQLGDTLAGRATGVDVFVTQIGLLLNVASLLVLAIEFRRSKTLTTRN